MTCLSAHSTPMPKLLESFLAGVNATHLDHVLTETTSMKCSLDIL